MKDARKTKAQLLQEVAELRQQLAAWQASEARSEHRRAEQAPAERIRQAEAVRAITAEITRELNLTTLLGLITQRAVDLVEAATSGAVYLWDRASEVLATQAWHGRGEWRREVCLRLGEGIAGTVAQRREGLLVNDYRTSPDANGPPRRGVGARAWRLAAEIPTTRVTKIIRPVTTINAMDRETTVSTALAKMTPIALAVRSMAKTSGRRCGGASASRMSE